MISYGRMPMKSRRELFVFYVLDTSGSMRGLPISTLNRAMGESLLALRQVAANNGDARIKVAVLEFNTGCRWMQAAGPEDMEDFIWEDLKAGGLTFMGDAVRELSSKMTRDEFLKSTTGLYVPVVIFMTDGYASDNYQEALDEALKNEVFSEAVRIGFAIGDDADVEMIARLTGSEEAVLKTNDLDVFADMLVFVTESASTMSIIPDGVQSSRMGAEVAKRARQRLGSDAGSGGGALAGPGSGSGGATADGQGWGVGTGHTWDLPDW